MVVTYDWFASIAKLFGISPTEEKYEKLEKAWKKFSLIKKTTTFDAQGEFLPFGIIWLQKFKEYLKRKDPEICLDKNFDACFLALAGLIFIQGYVNGKGLWQKHEKIFNFLKDFQ